MDYQQTLDFLFAQLPMYQRIGPAAYKKDLNNTLALCATLKQPQEAFKCIHIAGTNGKGSTSHMLASVFQHNGYKTGLYTSPHLIDFRERIRVNGEMVSEDFVIDFVAGIRDKMLEIKPSFFEITVVMAFEWFRQQEVDIAIIETGLGGRLDSTNVILPELSIITNIGYDHTDMLGNTLELIAGEKAGIIKKGVPVLIGEFQDEVHHVFEQKAESVQAPLHLAEKMSNLLAYSTDLKGSYQKKNLLTVTAAIEILRARAWVLEEEKTKTALLSVQSTTGLMGRWQEIRQNPRVICDTGHNAEGIRELMEQLKLESYHHLHLVFGQVVGKDPVKVLSLLPTHASYYFGQPSIPRSLPASDLAAEATKLNLKGSVHPSVADAYHSALNQSEKGDLIFVGGSTFVVADLLYYLREQGPF